MSAAGRRAIAQAAKARWAKYRGEAVKESAGQEAEEDECGCQGEDGGSGTGEVEEGEGSGEEDAVRRFFSGPSR